METLVSPTLEDGIFLGWATLRELISGPNNGPIHFDNQFKTLNTKLRRNFLEPTPSQNHADSSIDKNICQTNRVEVVEKIRSITTGKIAPTETSDATAAAKWAMFGTSAEATQSVEKTNAKEPRCKNECCGSYSPTARFPLESQKRDEPCLFDRFH